MNVFHIGHCFAAEKLSNHFESRILFVYLSLVRLLTDKSFRLLKSLTLSSFSCKYFCLNIQYSIISLNNKLFALVPFRSNLNSPKRRSFYPMFLHRMLPWGIHGLAFSSLAAKRRYSQRRKWVLVSSAQILLGADHLHGGITRPL